jgi:hypothetical protein
MKEVDDIDFICPSNGPFQVKALIGMIYDDQLTDKVEGVIKKLDADRSG